jgi:hypothetical protein
MEESIADKLKKFIRNNQEGVRKYIHSTYIEKKTSKDVENERKVKNKSKSNRHNKKK